MWKWFENLLWRWIVSLHLMQREPSPYILVIQNKNSVLTNYVLFGSSVNRINPTFGNQEGILVTYGLAGYTYAQFLCHTETNPFLLGRIRIDSFEVSGNPNLCFPLSLSTTSSEGTTWTRPITPHIKAGENHSEIELKGVDKVDKDTSITGCLIANSAIRISFTPAYSVSLFKRKIISGVSYFLSGIYGALYNKNRSSHLC